MSALPRTTVVVADDHDGFRANLCRLVESVEGLEIVGEARTGREAAALAERLRPHVVVMDLQMPDLGGVEATSAIVQRTPDVGVLVLTMFEDEQSIGTALRAGARGYLLKGAGRDELAHAIRAVARGQAILDPAAARHALQALSAPAGAGDAARATRTDVRLCGRLEVAIEGRRVEHLLPGRQGRLLLTYLVLHREREIPRDELVEAVWPLGAPAKADPALRALLSKTRRALGPDALTGKSVVALDLPAPVWVDVEVLARRGDEARRHLEAGAHADALAAAREALEACRHDPLADDDAPWMAELRRDLDIRRAAVHEHLGRAALAVGELTAAAQAARAVVKAAPYREAGHAILIRALARQGNTAEALRAYEDLRRRLRDELATAPCEELRALHEALVRGDTP